jgi:nitroimidazol reductase NimA-like FMN-containing flavoprotein (pyridoxamine 5'-phosphate oxidase superfamily)
LGKKLTECECFGLLAGQHLGRVVLVDDRGPIAFPVNFVLDRHSVVFRSGEGAKLDAAGRGACVAFEVDGADEATRTGWSVLVRGEAADRGAQRRAVAVVGLARVRVASPDRCLRDLRPCRGHPGWRIVDGNMPGELR